MNYDPTNYPDGELTGKVIAAAIEVHRILGPGLLESCYEACLCQELTLRGISFQRQIGISLEYKGVALDCGFRMDVLVENRVVVEIKAVESVVPVHQAQLITHLRLAHHRVGLLINFNVPVLKDGIIRRIV